MLYLQSMKKFPKAGGKQLKILYPDTIKVIDNDDFVFSLEKQMSVDDFNKIAGIKLTKISDCVYNIKENYPNSKRKFINNSKWEGKLIDYIPIPGKEKEWKADAQEWVYVIVYAGKIVKLGRASSGLSGRFASYNCGTKIAMKKGSCSTTNFVVTECNYFALSLSLDVEIYAYKIKETRVPTGIKIAGEELIARALIAPALESRLITLYKEETGSIPPLCTQKGGE